MDRTQTEKILFGIYCHLKKFRKNTDYIHNKNDNGEILLYKTVDVAGLQNNRIKFAILFSYIQILTLTLTYILILSLQKSNYLCTFIFFDLKSIMNKNKSPDDLYAIKQQVSLSEKSDESCKSR